MSRSSLMRAFPSSRSLTCSNRPSRHIYPPQNPSIANRSFLTTPPSTSQSPFWTQSYPPSDSESSASTSYAQIPYAPPRPGGNERIQIASSGPSAPTEVVDTKNKKRERKQRYLDSLMDKAGELSLRCSILDAEGNWSAEEGRYTKAELCKEYDLDPRDLRKLDSLTPNLVPLILTRRTCILISMLHVRALIKPDRVIIFDTAGSVESEVQRRFKWHLERNVRAGQACQEDADEGETGLNYEHRALESILVAAANALEEEMTFTRQLVQQLLSDLEDDINRDNLKRLLHYSRRLAGFQSRARYVKRAVDEVLESDEDLSAMYLTSKAQGKPRALHDHEQLELLLESFTKQVEEIVSEIDTTVANMNSTQEVAELMLDSGRNALLALDVKISIATLGVGTGALVAGVFGMNLTTRLEDHAYAFLIASGGATALALIVVVVGMRIMRKVRRIGMSGSGKSRSPIPARIMPPLPSGTARPTPEQRDSISKYLIRALQTHRASRTGRSGAGASEPVWINKAADMARARDASKYREMLAEKMAAGVAKDGRVDMRGEWWTQWSGDGEWDNGKWGKGKTRWAKE